MNDTDMPTITVFTPTYNREETLRRLYDSLCRQTSFDFEWLIVDDGSTDNTENTVGAFSSAFFPVRYVKKKNGGKHTAYNLALQQAMGTHILCVDSDDFLTPNAIEVLREAASPDCGICAYKATVDGIALSSEFPAEVKETTAFGLYSDLNCCGEYTFVYPVHIARKAPFPVFAGESFVTESVVYDRLDKLCKVSLLPKVITICEYQPDGLSARATELMKRNPAGYCLYFMQRIDLVGSLTARLLMAGKYQCFGILAHKNRTTYHGKHQLLTAVSFPLGLLFLLYYKLFRGF